MNETTGACAASPAYAIVNERPTTQWVHLYFRRTQLAPEPHIIRLWLGHYRESTDSRAEKISVMKKLELAS